MRLAAIIPAGGQASRLGYAAKPYLSLGGRPLLAHAVAAARSTAADPIVVVGPTPPPSLRTDPDLVGVTWTSEQPPGGGPAAAVAAGLLLLPPTVDRVLLLAADAPAVAAALPALLAADGAAAWALVDDRRQPLLSIWDVAVLEGLELKADGPLHRAMEAAGPIPVRMSRHTGADADTWDDLVDLRAHQEAWMTESRLQQWTATAAAEIGVTDPVDVDAVLDLAREAAHHVERPAAPVTTYLLGYAAAAQQLDAAGIAALADRLAALARRQPPTED